MRDFRILVEVEGSDEPAWAFLEYQHAHILSSMQLLFARAHERVKGKIFPDRRPKVSAC